MTNDTDRLPPHSQEAEAGIIGCILLSPTESLMQCIQQFPGSEVFYTLALRTVYSLLCSMHEKREAIDMITVQQRLRDMNQLEAVGGRQYLAELPDRVPSASHIDHYIPIVFEKFKLRTIIQGCSDIIEQAYNDEEQAVHSLEDFQKDLVRLSQMNARKADWCVKPAVKQALKDIEADIKNQGALTGLSTGFPELDRKTKGLQPGQFIVIGARPSMGKSSIVMNLAEHLAVDCKVPVGVFSLEMDKPSLMKRMISARSRVDLFSIDYDLLANEELNRLSQVAGHIALAPLYIDDTAGLDDVQLRSGIREMWHKHGIKVVMIDYFQLVHARRRFDNRALELSYISTSLKTLGRELGIPVILVAQLNRDTDALVAKGERPRISNLKDCGGLEQDADLIGLLYPTTKKDEDDDYGSAVPSAIDIAKHRNGPTGPIRLVFRKDIFRFEPASKIRREDVPRENADPRMKDP